MEIRIYIHMYVCVLCRKLAIRWHPDKNACDDEATAKFQDINNAYEYMCEEHGIICR